MKIILVQLLFTSLVYSFNLNFLKPGIQQADNVLPQLDTFGGQVDDVLSKPKPPVQQQNPRWKFWQRNPLAQEAHQQASFYYQKARGATSQDEYQFYYTKYQQSLAERDFLSQFKSVEEYKQYNLNNLKPNRWDD